MNQPVSYFDPTTAFFQQLAVKYAELTTVAERSSIYREFNMAVLRTMQRLLLQVLRTTPELVIDALSALKDVSTILETQRSHLDRELDRIETRMARKSVEHEYDVVCMLHRDVWAIIDEVETAFGIAAED